MSTTPATAPSGTAPPWGRCPAVETSALVVGGGPAGLAISKHLTERDISHLVIERGRLAERWRSERWDSLRLLTPNWLSGLPGWAYEGDDRDGFMTMPDVVGHLEAFAASFAAPVVEGTEVIRARPSGQGFEVETADATYRSDALVVATGAVPLVPTWGAAIAPSVAQLHSSAYRNPEQLVDGGVLVVGASASGLQLAEELNRAGRRVILSVGSHVRLPRRYRGHDVHRWLDLSGHLDRTIDQVVDIAAARRSPSLGLVGGVGNRTLDLNRLVDAGVQVTGRAEHAAGQTVRFRGDLADSCERADQRMYRLLDTFDQVAAAAAFDDITEPVRPERTSLPSPVPQLDLMDEGIGTVLWATGFTHSYPWLEVPVLDRSGAIRHRGGVVDWPGLFTMGLPFMRRRKSTFLDGIREDSAEIAARVVAHLSRVPDLALAGAAVRAPIGEGDISFPWG